MNQRVMLITHEINQNILDKLILAAPDWRIVASGDKKVWNEYIDQAEIIGGWRSALSEQSVSSSSLRWIQTWSAGVNSLPLNALKDKDILITSANGVHANPISETIFGLLLSLTRKIDTYVKNQQRKKWHHAGLSLEIHGKTIGIIGVGAIGKETAKIAKAFNMQVLGIRHSGKSDPFVDEMYTPDGLDDLLPRCDYVVVTLPLTEETKHIFTLKQFELMRDSAYFVNIGRGPLTVETDLVYALNHGLIAGAGLDVFDHEPLPEDHPFWEMDNVIITPHTAGSTEFYNQRVLETIFLPNFVSYLKGEKPAVNLLDFKKGY